MRIEEAIQGMFRMPPIRSNPRESLFSGRCLGPADQLQLARFPDIERVQLGSGHFYGLRWHIGNMLQIEQRSIVNER